MEALGLYVHVPFCEVKCHYCHFAIDPGLPPIARQERYTRAVILEMQRRAGAAAGDWADTLYFGGGTPSLLRAPSLAAIVAAARGGYRLVPEAEITLEANPRDLDEQGYAKRRAAGVNRLSLGLQHTDDDVLAAMGRVHRSADNGEAVTAARHAGFDNVSVDLILGWPGETEERWHQTVDQVLSLQPEHLSLYVLEVDGKNVLAHQQRAGAVRLPDDDLVADLYLMTVESLERAGLHRYEISNFARPGFESRHNAKYWDDRPFFGFGLSAHSYDRDVRAWNEPTFGRYCEAVEAGGTGTSGRRVLSVEGRRSEALFTGLRRRDGVDLTVFARRYGVDALAEFGPRLRDAFTAGLLEEAAGALRLTNRGVLVSNEVFRLLV